MVLSNDQRDLINDPSYIFTDKIAFQNILHCEAVTPVLLSHVHRRLYLDSIEPVFDIFFIFVTVALVVYVCDTVDNAI